MAQTVKLLKGIRCSNSGKTIYTRIFLEGEIEGHTFTKILLKNENPASLANLLFFSMVPDQSLLDQSRANVSVANIPAMCRYTIRMRIGMFY